MAIGDFGAAVIDTLEYDIANGENGSIIKVTDGIVAIWNLTSLNDGIVRTFPIDAAGNIGAMIDSWIHDVGLYAGGQYVVEIAHGIFMSVWRTGTNVLKAATFAIADDGVITHAYVSSVTSALPAPSSVHFMTHKPGTQMVVAAWTDGDNDGQMATITCNGDGTGIAVVDTWEFDPVQATSIKIRYIQGNIYALMYSDGGAATRLLRTVSIADDGTIAKAFIDTEVLAAAGYDIIKVAGNMCALIRTTVGTLDGIIATHTIDAAGNISAQIASATFEVQDLGSAFIGSLGFSGGLSYVLVYWTESIDDDGKMASYSIDVAGNLTLIDTINVTNIATSLQTFNAVMAQPNIWAHVYDQTGSIDGFLQTILIETGPLAEPSGAGAAHLRGRFGRRPMMG